MTTVRIQKVVFLPRAVAEQVVPRGNVGALTFHDPGRPSHAMHAKFAEHASFAFHDIDAPVPGKLLMSKQDAVDVFTFVERGMSEWQELLVSCELGQSRSAAAALLFAEMTGAQCFAGAIPVDALSYRIYNRLVYRRLYDAAYGAIGSAFEQG